jgi:transcriptional regulator with XRE-family HTH domain
MNALLNALQSSAPSWALLDETARRAGVTSRQASLARAGKPVNAGAYLALCAATGIDPIDGKSRPAKVLSPNVVWWLLSGALYITRHLKKLDQRAAAEVIGISAASVCRVECGQPVSIGVMLKVCAFIGVHPFGYTAPLVCPPEIISRETCTETYCSRSDISSDAAFSASPASV